MQRLGCGQRGGQAAGGAAIHHPIRGAAGLKLAAQFGIALLAVFLFSGGGQGQSSPVNNVMGTGESKEASGGAASVLSALGRACIRGCS